MSAAGAAAGAASGAGAGAGAESVGAGGGAESGDLLELEHVIGYTGRHPHTLHAFPTSKLPHTYVNSLGANVVVGDVTDPHRQEFLRAHDESVSALEVSKSGLLVASGQVGSTHSAGGEAPVVVWDFEGRRQLFNLFGIKGSVTNLAFAPDDQFLAATGSDGLLYIWDMQTGEQLVGKKFLHPVSFLCWGALQTGASRRPKYTLCYASNANVLVSTIEYQARSMRYEMTTATCALPSSGFVRDYPVGHVLGDFLLCGTVAGEFAVFKLGTNVYRAAVPASTNGVLCLASDSAGALYVGCGDGRVKKYSGSDTSWDVIAETTLRGAVGSLSVASDGGYLLAGTSEGRVYRVDAATLEAAETETSHVGAVTCLSFNKDRSDVFATGSDDGTVRVWDLNDYRVTASGGGVGQPCSVFHDVGAIVSGWKDGVLRSHDSETGAEQWKLQAHRGEVTSVVATEFSVVSGGADGKVAVWLRRSRELLLHFTEHIKPVVQVIADVSAPHLVHSAGKDRCVFTYDLKEERRIVGHQMSKTGVGAYTTLQQRKDNEQELITGGTDGKLLFWDCDVIETPVMAMQDPSQSCVNGMSVSPSGRFIALCSDDYHVKIFDIQRQTLLAAKLGHSARVRAIEWSPDERQVVSVGEDCCIAVWNWYG